MPIHDWTRVSAGIFHHFHLRWIAAISDFLNEGALPPGYFALAEQVVGGPIPDVLTLQLTPPPTPPPTYDQRSNGDAVVATAPPKTRFVIRTKEQQYARKANHVVVRHESGRVIAVIEIVSPGNKDSRHAIRTFVEKARALLAEHIHLLVVDLFPPTPRDPQGVHKAIWDEIEDTPFELPTDKRLTLASYSAGWELSAYVEPVAVGDVLPDMPLFLDAETHIPLALDKTYEVTWDVFPAALKPQLQ